ncbi:hypothetical protein ACFQH6_16640 [Halobacteriaceae archaeon GCM10025711]
MQEAWIDLQCPSCTESWEANPSELPAPDHEFACDHCGERRNLAEFMQSTRDLEVLQQFHA